MISFKQQRSFPHPDRCKVQQLHYNPSRARQVPKLQGTLDRLQFAVKSPVWSEWGGMC